MTQNVSLIVMMIIAIVLLFVTMVLCAIASGSAKKDCPANDKAEKYSMYAAIVAGLATFAIGVGLVIYIFRGHISKKTGDVLSSAGAALQQHANALQQHANALNVTAAAAGDN